MERYLNIAKVNLKFNLLPHIMVVLFLAVLAPVIMGVSNLEPLQVAKVVDFYLSLFGIVLCIPLFIPDEDRSVRELIQSKKESMYLVQGIRIVEGVILLLISLVLFLLFMKQQSSQFPYYQYLYGAVANGLFLGGLGIMMYSILDNLAVAYMIPILYYVMCMGGAKKYVGRFYLFSLMGGNVGDKIYLLVAGIIMIVVGIIIRNEKKVKLFINR
ncbi:MAG TPA: hypothetical protein DCE48_04105 [Lachnospiraceae bacterium]|uniref:hypothetical protein n=1 Tax=Anaerosporobacter sp. TaxID=1872529 RepID=UPI000EDACEE3|nr:hypothetical protein [Anaerosporobacter sp.]HAB59882.1 hypothetical protein [Lachnospiraceae bacterium]